MTFLKRLLASLTGPALVCAIFWVGGFDFNHRGGAAVCCAVMSTGVWIVCWILAWTFILPPPWRNVRF